MAPFLYLLSAALLAANSLPTGLAGPACARRNYRIAKCLEQCKNRWGWPGKMMGSDPWGSVMFDKMVNSWDATLVNACGCDPQTTTYPAVANAATGAATTVQISNTIAAAPTVSSVSSAAPKATSHGFLLSSSAAAPSHANTPAASPSKSPQALPTSQAPPPPPKSSSQAPPHPPPPSSKPSSNPSSAPAAPSGSGSNDDIQAYLSVHNDFRAQHGAAPLTWNDDLAAKAQQWANKCVFQHSGGSLGPFGENLAAGSGGFSIPNAIDSWTSEISEYDPSNPTFSHFTQVVWKATTQLGCAVQSCDGIFDSSFGKAKFYVCEYSPAGNVIGQFAENVQK